MSSAPLSRRRLLVSLVLAASSAIARECGQEELKAQHIGGCTSFEHLKYVGHRNAIWLAEALHNNTDLRTLDLHHTKIGDDDAAALAEGLRNNVHLVRLAMHNNHIYDKGSAALGEALAENHVLTHLQLSSNAVGDVGAKGLANGLRANYGLRRLDLYFNLVGEEGASAIADALHENRQLRILHLDTNHVGDAAAKRFASALDANEKLAELTLTYNQMNNEGIHALVDAAWRHRAMHALKIHHNHKVSGDAAEAAAKLKVEMEERQTLAKWLVEEGLAEDAESEGGPPLLSPFAAPARALQLHTREFRNGGAPLQALRDSLRELPSHAALRSLTAEQRDTLVALVRREVAKHTEKEEL